MRYVQLLTMTVVCLGVSGCRYTPWARDEVPVTPPTTQAPVERSAPDDPSGDDPAAPTTPADPQPTPSAPQPETGQVIGQPEVVAASILQVNNTFLTVDDIINSAALRLSEEIPPGVSEEVFRAQARQILRDEIQDRVVDSIIISQAQMTLSEPQREFIEQDMADTLRQMVADADGSRLKLQRELAARGVDLEDVLARQRRKLTVQMYLRSKFMPAVHVNRRMMWEYYQANREGYTQPKRVAMQIVAAPVSAFRDGGRLGWSDTGPDAQAGRSARARAREQIQQARDALQSGADFAQVAREYSKGPRADEGGLWPLMARGSFRQQPVEARAFQMDPGQVSDIIETDAGFYIVKAAQVSPAREVGFQDAQAEIEQILRSEQLEQMYGEYYQELLQDASVVQSEEFLPLAVDRAVERFHQR